MATLQITVTDGKFETTNGVHLERQSDTFITGNGWDAEILKDGTIECDSGTRYNDGKHTIRYAIYPNGIAKMTLLTPKGGMRILSKKRVYVNRGEKVNGIIGLKGGKVDQRRAFFRTKELQSFMEKYNISTVRACTPNGTFRLINRLGANGYTFSDIYTDGKIEIRERSAGETFKMQEEYSEKGYYEQLEIVKVSEANWTIVQQEQHEGKVNICYCILYSKNAVRNLHLPDIPTSPNRELLIP